MPDAEASVASIKGDNARFAMRTVHELLSLNSCPVRVDVKDEGPSILCDGPIKVYEGTSSHNEPHQRPSSGQ